LHCVQMSCAASILEKRAASIFRIRVSRYQVFRLYIFMWSPDPWEATKECDKKYPFSGTQITYYKT
jgi:hypothetical protein